VRALRGLLLPGRLSTVPESRNFLNSLLTPRFVQFSQKIRLSTFAVHPLKYKLFIKILSSSVIPCSLLTNTAVTSAVTNLRCHELIAKVNKQKNSNMENFICNQYGERFAILNTENIKICG